MDRTFQFISSAGLAIWVATWNIPNPIQAAVITFIIMWLFFEAIMWQNRAKELENQKREEEEERKWKEEKE
jgi:hypothetical protein